jgi:chaperonin GroES
MKRKDSLAAGARSATFTSTGKVNDEITIRTTMSDKDRKKAEKETAELQARLNAEKPQAVPRKKFIPTEDVLLVRPVKAEALSSLALENSTEQEKPAEGTVLEVGPHSKVIVGSHVVYGKYSGQEYKLNGELLLLLREDEVKGFLVTEQPLYEDENGQTWAYNEVSKDWDIPLPAKA